MSDTTELAIEKLQDRTRKLEDQLNLLRGGAAVLVASSIAFLGIEYLRIPSAVHDAVRVKIDDTTLKSITEAKETADALNKNSRESEKWDETAREGYKVVGNTLICFGTYNAMGSGVVWTRHFEIKFPHRFSSPPTVNLSCYTYGTSHTYAVYANFESSIEGCKGDLNQCSNTNDTGGAGELVKVSYIAIGRAGN